MTHFLLVFDRAEGRVLREEPFADHREALVARFEAERLHRGNDKIEVVVLGAESSEALRKTHARYFQTIAEMVQSALATEAARTAHAAE